MKYKAIVFSFAFSAPLLVFAQRTVVRGIVRDSKTKEGIPFVNIFFAGTQVGVTSDEWGRYRISTIEPYTKLQFSYIGYKAFTKILKRGKDQNINIDLVPETKLLEEIVVKPDKVKERYRNKGNPAVTLIMQVVKNRSFNRMDYYDYIEYEEYEKLQMSISHRIDRVKKNKLSKKYPFFFNSRDTTTLEGFSLLPIYVQEVIAENYFRKKDHKWKKIIIGRKQVEFDEFIDMSGVKEYLDLLYQKVDIYEDNIALLGTRFLSPISTLASTFYKFYLNDTLQVDGERLYELLFVPRNNTDFLFQGTLLITADSRFAVKQVNMMVNKHINLNWVRDLHIEQIFDRGPTNRYHLVKSALAIDFSLTEKGGGSYGKRVVSRKKFMFNTPHPDTLYVGKKEVVSDSVKRDNDFWVHHRHDSLSNLESAAYVNADSIQKLPAFRRAANIMTLILSGYQKFRYWELGPLGTFVGGNAVEGFRIRVGGRTTPEFNKHIYLKSYLAYGFRDRRWKYYMETAYSFTGNLPLTFPARLLQARYQHEIKVPGQELEFVQEDNFLLSFRRGKNNTWLYNTVWQLNYWHEFKNHFSFRVGVKRLVQASAGGLSFIVDEQRDSIRKISRVTTFETSLELRWAPQEKFYQGKKYRIPIRSKYPVFRTRLVSGIKGMLGGQYNYHNLSLIVERRFYMPQIGFTDIALEGGYIFGTVPFPFLKIHRANQTYSYQFKSYNLMNALEFVSDRYVSLQVVHHFNGFFLNKIPLIKKLKLREIISFKMLYGAIRGENIPSTQNGLFRLATNNGEQEIYRLDKEPYMELSLGIENILNFFRIDVVRRINYLHHPNVPKWGVRGRIRFYF